MTDPSSSAQPAYVVTGPTSGIGRRAALELAPHGTVVLVGRDQGKLDAVAAEISDAGGHAVSVVGDFSDPASARNAAEQVATLGLPIAGVLNNAGMRGLDGRRTAQGHDLTFATNHLGPFAFTEALIPHLADGTNVVFVCSAVEDPARQPAGLAGFRGARYESAEASARGEWAPGGSKVAGFDAYATSKQCNLATVLAFARETPRLRFNAVEPGVNPGTGLSRDAGPVVEWISGHLVAPLAPLFPGGSTPERSGKVIAGVLTDGSSASGVYYDEKGHPMRGSAQVHDKHFQDRVVRETRELLAQ